LAHFIFLFKNVIEFFFAFCNFGWHCKEHFGLLFRYLGFGSFSKKENEYFGTLLFFGGVLLTYFLISFAIPHALGAQHFALSYFSEFGDSRLLLSKIFFFHQYKQSIPILQPDRIDYLKQLFLPLGYLSFLLRFFFFLQVQIL